MAKLGNNEPDLPFLDLYDSAAPVAPTNTTRLRRSGNLLQVSTDAGAYVTLATGTPGANNILNIDEPPFPFLDIADGAEGVGPVNRLRFARLAGNLSASSNTAAYSVVATGSPGANNIVPIFQPMELVDIQDSAAPVAPANTMRLAWRNGSLQLSTDCGAYGALAVLLPPGAPILWYDGQDVDGLGNNNAAIVDGQQIGTWVNKGSLGVGANAVQATAGIRPLFRKVATIGKINNLSALEGDGTKALQSALFASQVQPITFYTVVRSNGVGSQVFIGGSALGNLQLYVTGGTTINIFGGANQTTGQVIVANTWHTLGATFSGAASGASKDNVASGVLNAGTNGYDTTTLFADRTPTSFMTGFIAEVVGYTAAPSLAAFTAYVTAKYGSTPQ